MLNMAYKTSDSVTRGDLFLLISGLVRIANQHHMALVSLKNGDMDALSRELGESSRMLDEVIDRALSFSNGDSNDVR
jgi:hypothetical protein